MEIDADSEEGEMLVSTTDSRILKLFKHCALFTLVLVAAMAPVSAPHAPCPAAAPEWWLCWCVGAWLLMVLDDLAIEGVEE